MKPNIKPNNYNLINSPEFISALKFESNYAIALKGGYLPFYLTEQKLKRLSHPVNLLSTNEHIDLIHSLFISKN